MFSKEAYAKALQWDLKILAPLKSFKVVQQMLNTLQPEDLEEIILVKDQQTDD